MMKTKYKAMEDMFYTLQKWKNETNLDLHQDFGK